MEGLTMEEYASKITSLASSALPAIPGLFTSAKTYYQTRKAKKQAEAEANTRAAPPPAQVSTFNDGVELDERFPGRTPSFILNSDAQSRAERGLQMVVHQDPLAPLDRSIEVPPPRGDYLSPKVKKILFAILLILFVFSVIFAGLFGREREQKNKCLRSLEAIPYLSTQSLTSNSSQTSTSTSISTFLSQITAKSISSQTSTTISTSLSKITETSISSQTTTIISTSLSKTTATVTQNQTTTITITTTSTLTLTSTTTASPSSAPTPFLQNCVDIIADICDLKKDTTALGGCESLVRDFLCVEMRAMGMAPCIALVSYCTAVEVGRRGETESEGEGKGEDLNDWLMGGGV